MNNKIKIFQIKGILFEYKPDRIQESIEEIDKYKGDREVETEDHDFYNNYMDPLSFVV
ncbi:MAG: hypothetical protein ACK5QC_15990 [Bacteroidota bacterium]